MPKPCNMKGQEEIQAIARNTASRLMGPNIYGFYYTHAKPVRDVCTAYDVKARRRCRRSRRHRHGDHRVSRSAKMGVSAIVGLGNKSDIDEDDL